MKSTAPQIKRSKWMALALLVLLTLLAAFPALAEEVVQTFELNLELYQCGGMPAETSRGSQYALMSDGVSLETYIVEQLKAQATEIDLSDYPLDFSELDPTMCDILDAHPELFFVAGNWGGWIQANGGVVLAPRYKYTGDELEQRTNAYNAELNRIVNYASSATSRLGKILLVNDYFCVHYQYDFSYSRYAADQLFIDKTGVCQAYMLGFRAVMNALGIPCVPATSPKPYMNHTWNMVELDGSWYHIDVTWNDPTSDMPYRACHNIFLLSDSGIAAEEHYNWTSTKSATSSKYDTFFWRDVCTTMPLSENRIYYVVQPKNSATRYLRYWEIGGGTAELHSFESYGWYYYGYYPVQLVENKLCYATSNQLYLYDPEQKTSSLIYTQEDPSLFIVTGYYSSSEGVMKIGLVNTQDYEVYVVSVPIEGVPKIELDTKQLLVEPEKTVPLKGSVENVDNPPPIIWESADTDIAMVDEQGLVTGIQPGITTITATCGELTTTCEVLVYQFTFEDLDGKTLPQGYTYMMPPIAQPEDVLDPKELSDESTAPETTLVNEEPQKGGWRVESTVPEVARVNADGSFTTLTGGEATITVQSISFPNLKREMAITVEDLTQIALPAGLTTVEKEAFAGASFQRVNANAALESIGSRAFADCKGLKLVCLGGSVNEIADDAFEGCTDVAFLCPAGSYAARYAQEHNMVWSDSGEE